MKRYGMTKESMNSMLGSWLQVLNRPYALCPEEESSFVQAVRHESKYLNAKGNEYEPTPEARPANGLDLTMSVP